MSNKRNNFHHLGFAVALALVIGSEAKGSNTQETTDNTGTSVMAIGNANVTTCNPVFSGNLKDSPIKIKCGADIPTAAVAKLETHLQVQLSQTISHNQGTAVISGGNANVLTCNPEFRGDLRNSPITVECGISPAQVAEMAADWEKQYREQVTNLKEQLVFNPNDKLLKSALAAALDGDFDRAFQLRKQRFDQGEEKVLPKLAAEAYQVAQAAQLTFKPQEALPYLEKAYGYQPDNFDYAIAYADLLQKQNERKQAEGIYQKLLTALREEVVTDPSKRDTLNRILNNLGNLVQADSQRRTEAETLYR
ncbi:tetratricopeptide repeat protein, partial [Thiothrix litoralis]|uniref:tetratricopeptide repeat protein n=1 Tax=Thiothrix litoralis TaxID=2891210 RepID=UPI003C764E68